MASRGSSQFFRIFFQRVGIEGKFRVGRQGRVAGDVVFPQEINEMGEHIAGGGGQEGRGRVGVDGAGEALGGGGAVGEGAEDIGLAALAVSEQPADAVLGALNRAPWPG